MNSLIEKYMVSHPHLRRSDDEKGEMDRSDDISTAVAGGCSFKPGNNDQFQGDDESDDDGEDDDDEDESDYLGTSANGSGSFVFQPGPGVVPTQFTPSGSMVDNFTAVTGADAATATRVLASALSRGLGLENAVSYYFEQTEAGNVL